MVIMKKVEIDYTYTVFCYKTIEVPDDFTFESTEPDDMVDEIDFDISDIDVTGEDFGTVEFDGIRSVEVDGECYMN
jgi:hypothetical protein